MIPSRRLLFDYTTKQTKFEMHEWQTKNINLRPVSHLFLRFPMLKHKKPDEQAIPIAANPHIAAINGTWIFMNSSSLCEWSIGWWLSESSVIG